MKKKPKEPRARIVALQNVRTARIVTPFHKTDQLDGS
jgi:hypothetical protein